MLVKDLNNLEKNATRKGFGDEIVELGKENNDIIALTADLACSVKTDGFEKQFPDRHFNVGIAEQNMLGIAAGLAFSGKIPFAASFSCFITGRAWDQIRTSVCYAKANVKIIGTHSGVSIGPDGATQMGTEDIAVMRCIPNIKVIVPCDYLQARKATKAAAETEGPLYLRLGRPKAPIITTKETPFELGKAQVFNEGTDVTIIACGECVYTSLLAAEKLKQENISAEVINLHTIKPIDKDTILNSVKKTKAVITIEDHQIFGGMGSAVAELLSENCPAPMKIIGIQDRFGQSGTEAELMKEYNLTDEDIIKAVKEVLKQR